jgi:hypothetical protein
MSKEKGNTPREPDAGKAVDRADPVAERRARAAEALRANLRRRKAQARERGAGETNAATRPTPGPHEPS